MGIAAEPNRFFKIRRHLGRSQLVTILVNGDLDRRVFEICQLVERFQQRCVSETFRRSCNNHRT